MQSPSKTKQVNTSLLEQASIHLLAAYGQHIDRDELHKQPLNFLTIVLRIAQAQGFTLEDVERQWNEVKE